MASRPSTFMASDLDAAEEAAVQVFDYYEDEARVIALERLAAALAARARCARSDLEAPRSAPTQKAP